VRIVLLERSDALLKQFGAEWASREALQVLSRRGISVHLQTTVERVSEQAVSLGSGKRISAATIIWVAGIRAPRLLADSGLATDGQGRIPVDRYLRGTGPDQALIFAAGDCASVPDLSGRILPATASYAMRQGEHLAETLLMEVRGQPPRAYVPYNPGLLVSLGPGEAVGSPLGVPACGLPTWLLKEAVERWYLTTL
jgi:NADH dehydrogenase